MSNPLPNRWLRGPIVDKDGHPTVDFMRWLRDLEQKTGPTLNVNGQIQSTTKIAGRSEKLGTTVQNLTNTGQLSDADKIAADGATFGRVNVAALTTGNVDLAKSGVTNKTTDNLSDGTGSPLAGGKRGFQALDTNNRLASSFRNNALNASAASTSSTTLSNDGISTAITIAASSQQFGPGTVAYNSGSIDPGGFGVSSYIFADDPTFAGGAVAYSFSATPPNQAASDSRVIFGKINTTGGVAKTGGGYSGGTTSGGSNVKGIVA